MTRFKGCNWTHTDKQDYWIEGERDLMAISDDPINDLFPDMGEFVFCSPTYFNCMGLTSA